MPTYNDRKWTNNIIYSLNLIPTWMKLRQPKVMHMQPVAPIPKVKACVTPSRGSRWPNMGEVRKTTSSKTPNTRPYSVDEAPCAHKMDKIQYCGGAENPPDVQKISQMRTRNTCAFILENPGVIINMIVKSTFSLARVRIKNIYPHVFALEYTINFFFIRLLVKPGMLSLF